MLASLGNHMSTRVNEFGQRFNCFVINLKRQSVALQEFLERNKRTGIEFQVFQAVDGREANNEALRSPDFITPDTRNYTPGALGAAMSHRKLWERCEKSGKPIIVFEDDAWTRADFCSIISASVPAGSQGWDIILCGYNLDSILDFELVPGCNLHGSFSVHHPPRAISWNLSRREPNPARTDLRMHSEPSDIFFHAEERRG